ncbi:type II toxin-antitoxin system HicA family toxin [Aliiroseovarius sp. Z3]|nr:type II toxin-antitoxin system HicA family toxin [Aliiroseovarius sp. Z3]
MVKGFYNDVIKQLKKVGYYKVKGGKGSHEKWCHDGDLPTLTVPKNMLSRHTANGILSNAGLPKI